MRIFPNGIEKKPLIYIVSEFNKKSDRWGLAGAGVLYFCPEDNTILLLHRSNQVEDPNTWGIPGGAVKGTEGYWEEEDESPEYSEEKLRDSAFSEVSEELGHFPEYDKEEGRHTTINNNFHYTTFLVIVNLQQKGTISRNIQLNWENDGFDWFRIDFLPENVHSGVEAAIQNLIYSKKQLEFVM